jgi:hydroxymethylpyrimidine/phosphomethylpyrimidine kinase
MDKKIALSIAGFDPSGGAGIQADLKTFSSIGVHGVSIVTCITSQNTRQVTNITNVPNETIQSQFECLIEDIHIDAVKLGLISTKEIALCVSKLLRSHQFKYIIDPIIFASSGDALTEEGYVEVLKTTLIPQAYLVVPNLFEAETLVGKKIKSVEEIKEVCKRLYNLGPQFVLIKGGHIEGERAIDVLFDGKKFLEFSLPKIQNKITHGSGCSFSALIAGFLASGERCAIAIKKAKHILWNMLNNSYRIGKGAEMLNHSYTIINQIPQVFSTESHFSIWLELKTSVDTIVSFLPKEFVPEVGMNIGYAIPHAKDRRDICAVDGRIVKGTEGVRLCGKINFGVSRHIASIILTTMSYDTSIRCAANLRYTQNILSKCKQKGFTIGAFDRKYEPHGSDSTMQWGIKEVISKVKEVPDIIIDKGSHGKEPMIRILGKTPQQVVEKIRTLV